MLVVNRFRVPEDGRGVPRRRSSGPATSLAERPGYVDGRVGRNLDDPTLWALVTTWENVGAYRRALSSYDVKLQRRAAAEPGDRRAERLRAGRAGDRPQRSSDAVVRLSA